MGQPTQNQLHGQLVQADANGRPAWHTHLLAPRSGQIRHTQCSSATPPLQCYLLPPTIVTTPNMMDTALSSPKYAKHSGHHRRIPSGKIDKGEKTGHANASAAGIKRIGLGKHIHFVPLGRCTCAWPGVYFILAFMVDIDVCTVNGPPPVCGTARYRRSPSAEVRNLVTGYVHRPLCSLDFHFDDMMNQTRHPEHIFYISPPPPQPGIKTMASY